MPRLTPHAKHLAKGYCPEIEPNSQGWCLEKLGHSGDHQAGKDIHWSTERQFPAGWLQNQISEAAASLDGLDPQVRAALAHRTGKDNAAGIRGTISRLEQLNDDGTPAPPTQEDAPALPAEQGSTRRGQYWISEEGNGRSVSPTGRLPQNSPPLPMHSVIAALEQLQSRAWGSQPLLNMHLVEVSDKTLRCAPRCAGPGEHLDEYRAADVRPSTAQTTRNAAAGS